MNSPTNRTPSRIMTDGTLSLETPAGFLVTMNNGLDMMDTNVQNVAAVLATNVLADEVLVYNGLYVPKTLVVGGTEPGFPAQDVGVLAFGGRSSHAPNPSTGYVSFYIYHNTGTGKREFHMRNSAGATVKIAEIAA